MLDISVKPHARPVAPSLLLGFGWVKTINEIRLENLKALLAEAGSQAEIARKTGKSTKQVSQWFGKGSARNISDENCRLIEECFGRPIGWMDNIHSASQPERTDLGTLTSAMKMVHFVARMQATDAARFTNAEAQAKALHVALEILSRDPSQALDLAGASERMAAQLRGEEGNEQAVERR
jgi:hypothetical protein